MLVTTSFRGLFGVPRNTNRFVTATCIHRASRGKASLLVTCSIEYAPSAGVWRMTYEPINPNQ